MPATSMGATCWRRSRVGSVWAQVSVGWVVALSAFAQGVCDPLTQCCPPGTAAGAACGSEGPTTWSAASPVDVGVGNPINLVNGNKHLQEVDMAALPGVLGLELVRHYNSANSGVQDPPGSVGWGWRFSYESTLTDRGNGRVEVRQADGTQWAFAAKPLPPTEPMGVRFFTGPAGEVRAVPDGTGWRYRWRWTRGTHAGRELWFDAAGRLLQITAATGEWLTIRHDLQGRLAQVTDPQGRSLWFHPVASGASGPGAAARFVGTGAVDTPLGRYTYRYGTPKGAGVSARLEAVDLPTHTAPGHSLSNRPVTTSTTSRRYHHEDPRWPAHVTGISVHGTGGDGVPTDWRLATYAYNAQGRAYQTHRGAISAAGEHGPASTPEVSLVWPQRGWVWLANGQGQQTVYRTTYLGGHVRVLEARGAGCPACGPVNRSYRYDRAGRLVGMNELAPVVVHQGQPLPPERVLSSTKWVRDTLGRVERLEQVVHSPQGRAGSGALWRLAYGDPRWPDHPTRLEQPSVRPGVWQRTEWVYNAQGQVERLVETGYSPLDAQAMVRTTAYRYQQQNGRSLLVEVDGPLPNGPLATPQDSDITRIVWDAHGHAPTRLERPGRMPDHVAYQPGSGLLASVASASGVRTDWAYDAQQQPVHTRTQAPGWQTPLWHGYQRNTLGWVTTWQEQAPGEVAPRDTRRAAYNPQGQLLWQAGALGLARTYRYGPEGGLVAVQRHSPTMRQTLWPMVPDPTPDVPTSAGVPLVPAPVTEPDDWGRPVRTTSPDGGTSTRVFDASDRLVAMTDAQGHTAHYSWDLRGRLVRQDMVGAHTPTVSTHWRYNGDHLVALNHPTQSEVYGHDSRGLRNQRTVLLPKDDGTAQPLRVDTLYRHDAAGRLAAMRLPGGMWLRYLRNGQGQVVALTLNPVETPWLQTWARELPVVSGLERDLVGLRRWVAGNGIETLYQRSRQGLLARVVHRRVAPEGLPNEQRAAWGWAQAHARAIPSAPAQTPEPPGALGWAADPQALWDQRYLWDHVGNLVHQQQKAGGLAWSTHAYDGANRWVASVGSPGVAGGAGALRFWRQAYDVDGRRLGDQSGEGPQSDLQSGTRRHRFEAGTHRLLGPGAAAAYNLLGQPTAWNGATLQWDVAGRLATVARDGTTLARYGYDHRGLRNRKTTAHNTTHTVYAEDQTPLAELDARGQVKRQYIHLAGLPLATWDSPEGQTPVSSERGAVVRLWSDLGAIWRSWWGQAPPLVWLHHNHLEAPVLATDHGGQVVWQARYSPTGQAEVPTQDWALHLRIPGQYADTETGWVYNRQRYLDLQLGQYLSPDPLGVPDGPNPYAHVAHNPLRYVDPDGLILFSFDGTNNNLASQTNVQQFARHYADYSAYDQAAQIGWGRFYTPGPGASESDWLDGGVVGGMVAPRLREIVNNQLALLTDYVQKRSAWEVATAKQAGRMYSPAQPLDIQLDVVGFSRGAAAAREFLNRVDDLARQGHYRQATGGVCVRVIPRFAGLFDTVLSYNTDFNMRMAIPEAVRYVAHAVAVNEHRALFPLESIEDSYSAPGFDGNRVERGFIGAHGDIGGTYTVQDGSDLSDVALQWMWQQAAGQGLRMDALEAPLQVVSNPVVHDERRALLWRTLLQMEPTPEVADRRVLYRAAPDRPLLGELQRKAPVVGLDHPASLGLLTFRDLGLTDLYNTQVADVDMVAYRAWLVQHHKWRQ